jgi:DNA-binding PadR family transcriptional regulator
MSTRKQSIEDQLPVNPPVFHILLALAEGESHGYAIMQEVAERSGGAIKLGPGTLYYSIKRMVANGLIEESDERPTPDADDERRRYYRVTEFGRAVAEAESQRLADLVELARAKQYLRAR